MENQLAQSNLGAGIIIVKEEHILLVQMNYGKFKGHWIIPGGMVEAGEHPEQAAIRELKEETNLTGIVDGLLAVRHRIYPDKTANVYWVFIGTLTDAEEKISWPEEELIEAKFWKLSDALNSDLVRPITQEFIKKYINSNNLNINYELKNSGDYSDSAFGIQ